MQTLGITHGVCEECRTIVPAKVVAGPDGVYLCKFCPEHGESLSLVRSSVDDYLQSLRYVKPAWRPARFSGDDKVACPEGCGYCTRHEQHLCLPIVEITSECNLACPICIANAGGRWRMSLGQFKHILDVLIKSERQVDLLNISGGEPLLHPQLIEFVEEAVSRPEIVRVSISTNGLKLLEDPALAGKLRELNTVVSLQFDGFDDAIYDALRGRPLLRHKLDILALLDAQNVPTSLVMTAMGGVNEDQFRPILDYLFSHQSVVSLMVQPVAFAGRAGTLAKDHKRLTITDVVKALGDAGHPYVSSADFVPLPCGHPLCFSLSLYLVLDNGKAVSMNRLAHADTVLDALANRTVFGLDREEHERIKQLIYDLWAGPVGAAPDGQDVLKTIRSLLTCSFCSPFDPRKMFSLVERRVKSIFVHAFQDAGSFDLARVRRCCNAYPQPDGSLMPACVFNVLRRPR